MADDLDTTTNNRRRDTAIILNRMVLWFARKWSLVLMLGFVLYAGLPFVAPLAMEMGMPALGRVIYMVYQPLCHQFTFRSWFLFGEQGAYPRERAVGPDFDGVTFEEMAAQEPYFASVRDLGSLEADLVLAARGFVGSQQAGWKVAYCQRDIAIYGMIGIGSLLYFIITQFGGKVPPLPFWGYLLIAIAPIGLDGFSQLFANPPFNGFGLPFYPIRESTPILRTITGALFGFGNVWLAFPYIEESMKETAELVENKFRKAGIKFREV